MEMPTGKILIVDDDKLIMNLLSGMLDEDYDVICADNSLEGLRLARQEQIDLVLLDINMPIFDGQKLCQTLKGDPETKDIPIIFITALVSAEDETKGLEAGAADYIAKPINKSVVLARVKIQIEAKQQREYLEKLSTTDPLTGVPNRRCFDETLEREWRRCQRSEKPLSLLVLDIDCFKLYNDCYGHLAGDSCLIKVAQLLTGALSRGGDLLARIGGEEFVALLPDTPFESLDVVADRFRTTIEEAAIPHERSPISEVVTISVGGSTLIPNQKVEPVELHRRADEQLYVAKEKGRNHYSLGVG